MRRGLVALTLSLLAAPIWAPPLALAAKTNTLSAPLVSPAIGTTSTIFTFSVHYSGSPGAPATAVTADVAGLRLALTLISGTSLDGTWAGSTYLPTGTWKVAFAGTAAKGNSPSLQGPPVVVVAPSAPPSVSPGLPGGSAAGESLPPSPSGVPGPAGPTPTPSTGLGNTTASPGGKGSSNPVPAAANPSAGSSAANVPSATGRPPAGNGSAGTPNQAPGAGGPTSGNGGGPQPGPMSSAVANGGASSANGTMTDPLGVGGMRNSACAAIGLAGAAALAFLALLVLRRRRREVEVATPSRPSVPAADPTLELSPRARANARRRMSVSDDPVLRAMGLDPDAPAAAGASSLRARARRVNRKQTQDDATDDPRADDTRR